MENSELDLATRIISLSADYSQKVESVSPEQTAGGLRNEKLGVSIEGGTVEDKSSVSDGELIFHSEKESLQSSLLSYDSTESSCYYRNDVSPSTSDYAKQFGSPSKVRMISSYFTEDLECPSAASSFATYSELDFSSVACDKQIAETALVSCSSSLLTNAMSCDDPVICGASFSDSSGVAIPSKLPPVLSSKNDAVELEFVSTSSLLLLKSVEEITARNNEVMSLTGLSGNEHVWFREHAQSGAFISSFGNGMLEDSSDIITDPDMETIDLLDEMKAEESCANVSTRELYAASQRAHKLRSYKKKIQDAFYSKKRLAKEYELLAIWFGDTDIEDRSHTFVPSISTTATPLDSRSLQTDNPCDSEWELL